MCVIELYSKVSDSLCAPTSFTMAWSGLFNFSHSGDSGFHGCDLRS